MSNEELLKETKDCPYIKECSIFATYMDPNDKKYMKILNTYCYGDYKKCARYKLKSNNKNVPVYLLPDGSSIECSSLKKNLFIGILFTLLFISIVNFGIFHFQLDDFYREFQNSLLQYAITIKKDELKNKMDIVFSVVNKIYQENKDKLPPQKVQELIKETLRVIRYGKSGYFFIDDFNYTIVLYPIKREYEGKVIRNKNSPLHKIVNTLKENLKKNKYDAYVRYKFYNPATKKEEEKISYIKFFEPYGWVIGTGAYLPSIKKSQRELYKVVENVKNMRKKIEIISMVVGIVFFILAILIINFILKKYLLIPIEKMSSNLVNIINNHKFSQRIELTKQIPFELISIVLSVNKLLQTFKNISCEILKVTKELSKGNLNIQIDRNVFKGELEELAYCLEDLAKTIKNILLEMEKVSLFLAKGKIQNITLNKEIFKGELSKIERSLERIVTNFKKIISIIDNIALDFSKANFKTYDENLLPGDLKVILVKLNKSAENIKICLTH